ncbi:MAG: heterodisulfide reductase-related iron-sulfur binding cluster [Candidatus Rokubacteria bacterium]|nr:heterodisulfide reductase-related iron-sulfur binding cluster [Candidatus Rokubacteria bacterium]
MAYDYKRYFGEIAVIRDLTTMPEEVGWRTTAPAENDERHPIVLYLGCNVFRTSHMIQTITAIFDRLGLDYVAVGGPTYCCGIVHHQQGDTAAAGGMADHTIKLFERYQPDEVVMWCPSCIYFYDEVRQAQLPFKVSHAAEFLVSRLPELRFTGHVNASVALHYHNFIEPRRREGLAGRRLLEAVPGLRYVEIEPDPRFGRSCTPSVQQQVGLDAWNRMARDEIDRACAAGAGTLATIYHGCQRYICVFELDRPIAIEHYLSVFARGLGIEFEDKFKKYRLWQDPERVLAETTPCQRANNVVAARAREVVQDAFGPLPSARDAADAPPS